MFRLVFLTIAVCALFMVVIAHEVVASDNVTAAELLTMLRAKDEQFDNVKLDYDVRGQHTTEPFPAWKYPSVAKEYGWEHEEPVTIQVHFHESLIVRGPNTTFIRSDASTPADGPEETTVRMIPSQKWSNAQGVAREITRTGMTGRGHAIMEIRPGGLPVDIAQEQAMAIEFAHGFGYGKRIQQIDKISQEGNSLRVEGTIQIWWEDSSRFSILLDDDYLVREARIESDVRGNRTVFEIKTEGTATAADFVFAARGSFTRTAMGKQVNGATQGKPKIVKQFQTEFTNIQANLDDATYNELIAMPLEPGMQVIDHITGTTYFAGEEPPELLEAIKETVTEVGTADPTTTAHSDNTPVSIRPVGETHTEAASRAATHVSDSPSVRSHTRRYIIAAVMGAAVMAVAAWLIVRYRLRRRRGSYTESYPQS